MFFGKKNNFSEVETKSTKHKQTNNRPKFSLNRNIYSLNKTGPGQIRTEDLWRTRRIRYHQAKCARETTKVEFIMSQGTTMSPMSLVDKVFHGKKSNPLAIPLLIARVIIFCTDTEMRDLQNVKKRTLRKTLVISLLRYEISLLFKIESYYSRVVFKKVKNITKRTIKNLKFDFS